MRAHEQVVADLKKASYGTWKSKVEKFLYGLCDMKLNQFPDYPFYEKEYELGFEPRETALNILEHHGFKMEFEKN